jgi:hypothetical protein
VIRKKTGPTGPGSRVVDITLSSNYATGGDPVPLVPQGQQGTVPNTLGLRRCHLLQLCGAGSTGYALEAVHDPTNPLVAPKIRAWRQSATTGALQEVPAATNLSAVTVRAIAYDFPYK